MTSLNATQLSNDIEEGAQRLNTKTDAAVEAGRQAASGALTNLQGKVDALADRIPPAVNQATTRVAQGMRRGLERANTAARDLRARVDTVSENTAEYVKARPMKSMAIAAGAGAALALIAGWMVSHRKS